MFNANRQCHYKEVLFRGKCFEGHDSQRFVCSFLSFMKYFLSLSSSAGHQQYAIGLSTVNAILYHFKCPKTEWMA